MQTSFPTSNHPSTIPTTAYPCTRIFSKTAYFSSSSTIAQQSSAVTVKQQLHNLLR